VLWPGMGWDGHWHGSPVCGVLPYGQNRRVLPGCPRRTAGPGNLPPIRPCHASEREEKCSGTVVPGRDRAKQPRSSDRGCLGGVRWGYQDLNLGPLPYQGSALTD
jgi:hypothetical protein